MQKTLIVDVAKLANVIKGNFLFNEVENERLEQIINNITLVDMAANETLFVKGETYHKGIYYIIDGELDFINEDEQLVQRMVVGDVVGITTFLGKSIYLVTARSHSQCELVYFPEICIYKLLADSENFREKFYHLVTERLALLQGSSAMSAPSYSYKPVGSYMTTPILTVDKDTPVIEVSKIMSQNKIGSIAVVDENQKLKGLITTKDIVHNYLIKLNENNIEASVESYMDEKPISIPKEYPLVEALAEMQQKNKDYSVIVQKDIPLGIISNKDILKILYRNVNTLNVHIELSESLDDLKSSYDNLYKVVLNLMENTRMSGEILPVLSSIHLNIQKKVHKLTAEKYYQRTSVKITELNHSLIIMGSGARKEMMLEPDQDNGFIFDDNLKEEEIQHLMSFGKEFSDNLAYVGYKKCPGNIMVTNPEMSKTLTEWKYSISELISNPGNKGFMWSSIIFDLDGFSGNENLVWKLRDHILKLISERPIFLIQMLENDTQHKIPISMFGKFIVEKDGEHKGKFNMKSSALAFIVDVTRAYTLSHALGDTNTLERLKHISRKRILSEETIIAVSEAYETVVDILINKELDDKKKGLKPNKYVNPNELSLYNQNKLREALNTISKYMNNSTRHFKGQLL